MSDEEKIRYRDAFPKDYDLPTYFTSKHAVSMSLRDYMAAKAMQGYCSNQQHTSSCTVELTADCAYEMADAMMKAREE